SVLNFYKDMIRMRKEYPQFVYGEYELLLTEHKQIFAYTRSGDGGKAFVICNFSADSAELMLPAGIADGKVQLMLYNYPDDDMQTLRDCTLKPYEARVYICNHY